MRSVSRLPPRRSHWPQALLPVLAIVLAVGCPPDPSGLGLCLHFTNGLHSVPRAFLGGWSPAYCTQNAAARAQEYLPSTTDTHFHSDNGQHSLSIYHSPQTLIPTVTMADVHRASAIYHRHSFPQ